MASPFRRFRPEINVRAPNALINSVTQGVLEEGHAGVLLDESMQSFAFAARPTLSSFVIPSGERDVLCRRAAYSTMAMDVGVLAAEPMPACAHSERMSRGNRGCGAAFTAAALQFPAPLSNVEGLKSVFELALAEIVRRLSVHAPFLAYVHAWSYPAANAVPLRGSAP
jgi:hypothetical protein